MRKRPDSSPFGKIVVGTAVVAVLVVSLCSLRPYLGALIAFDNPEAQGAPSGAVVRVSAPEGEAYRIQWGSGLLPPVESGMIDPELGYRDHPLNSRAADPSGRIYVTVYAGDGDPYPLGDLGKEIGAVLFASGEYATCERAEQSVRLEWAPRSGGFDLIDNLRKKATCGSYRFSIP